MVKDLRLCRAKLFCLRQAGCSHAQRETEIRLYRAVALNANRLVTGTLRGFDQFMNIVLDGAVDEKAKTDIGMVVSPNPQPCIAPWVSFLNALVPQSHLTPVLVF